jgi:hypothetical protein
MKKVKIGKPTKNENLILKLKLFREISQNSPQQSKTTSMIILTRTLFVSVSIFVLTAVFGAFDWLLREISRFKGVVSVGSLRDSRVEFIAADDRSLSLGI